MTTGGYQLLSTTQWGAAPAHPLPNRLPRLALFIILSVSVLLLGGTFILSRSDRATHIPIYSPAYTFEAVKSSAIDSSQLPQQTHSSTEQSIHREPELLDLGEDAESRYHLGFEVGYDGTKLFYDRLIEFAQSMPTALQPLLLDSIALRLPRSHQSMLRRNPAADRLRPVIEYRNIFQTDKVDPSEYSKIWEDKNRGDGWVLDFYSDARAQEWVDETFHDGERGVKWAYHAMRRGVLKADFLRYLLPMIKGGVYSDTDTWPKRRIQEWGKTKPEAYDISSTDGVSWRKALETEPAVIVGVDIDVHERLDWFTSRDGWYQALGICQWALASAPGHPIMQEVTRRVVNNTRFIDDVHATKEWQDKATAAEEWARLTNTTAQYPAEPLRVLEWTGPAVFTDSVLSYLAARYRVTWHQLRGLKRPLRIGEVLVLPITGFSPGGEKDFNAEGSDSPQCALVHNFRGSWKGDGV